MLLTTPGQSQRNLTGTPYDENALKFAGKIVETSKIHPLLGPGQESSETYGARTRVG